MDFNDLMATPIPPSFLAQSAAALFPSPTCVLCFSRRPESASAIRAAGFTFDLDEMELLIRSSRFRYDDDDDV
jgi:hypothetical protein